MNRTDAPTKQAKPFAINGQREAILPTTPPGDNSASYESGFPPITMTLKSAGGLPPKGQDMNQILYELSSLARWQSAGALNSYDSSFATAIGGYPKGAMLIGDSGLVIYISTTDGNVANPNTGGAGWSDLTSYLGLMSGAPAIGIPFFWPSSAMPNTVMPEWSDMVFLKFNGATFSAATYPKLALVFPGLTIPEARGEFPRIWDDGRGVDNGRTLLSAQGDAMQRMTGSLADVVYQAGQPSTALTGPFSGVGNTPGLVSPGTQQTAFRTITVSFDTQNAARTASETRSRNIAFNFLVRAK